MCRFALLLFQRRQKSNRRLTTSMLSLRASSPGFPYNSGPFPKKTRGSKYSCFKVFWLSSVADTVREAVAFMAAVNSSLGSWSTLLLPHGRFWQRGLV